MKMTRRDMLAAAAGALLIRPISVAAKSPKLSAPPARLSEKSMQCLAAASERLLPGATEAGCGEYLSFWLKTEPFAPVRSIFETGTSALDDACAKRFGKPFVAADGASQDEIIKDFIASKVKIRGLNTSAFIENLMELTIEGFLSDPKYGGNKDRIGWRFIGIPDGLKSCWWNPNGVFTVLGPRPKFSD